MQRNFTIFLVAPIITLLFAGFCASGAAGANSTSGQESPKLTPELSSTFARLVSEKRSLAETITKEHKLVIPPQVRDFFVAAKKDDWFATSNLFGKLLAGMYPPSQRWVPTPLWGAIHEVFGTYELLEAWNPKFLMQFGTNTVGSIPPGSLYFGGSEAGRFLVSLFSQSHSEGRPFFTLTQNALSDPAYIAYLHEMYGKRIYVPSTNDVQKYVEEYTQDAKARMEHDEKFPSEAAQIQGGEDVRLVCGKVQVNGPIAVMAIHALVLKSIFEKNPDRQFFLEESYPLKWTYPRLTPHQFVFKINREMVAEIPTEALRSDHEFWIHLTDAWLGAWLNTNTPIREIAEFAKTTYLAAELKDFRGDLQFVRDLEARRAFSHFRACIGGLYWWRATQSSKANERQRMTTEADFAFRQAFAICPSNPEVVFRYTDLLTANGRVAEALLAAEAAQKVDSENPQFRQLLEQLSRASSAGSPPIK